MTKQNGARANARERSFGLSVGTLLCLLGAYQWWRDRVTAAEALAAIGIVLIASALTIPRLLVRPANLWFRFSHALGYVNTRILLTVLFFGLLAPVGLLWRVIGRDPLGRKGSKWPGWTPYPPRYRDRMHYRRMF